MKVDRDLTSPYNDFQRGRQANRSFWLTIFIIASICIILWVLGLVHNKYGAPRELDITSTMAEEIFDGLPRKALDAVKPEVETLLDAAYAPVYDAIPHYADFHYSVLGEYTELTEAAFGTMTEAIEARLFDGMGERLSNLTQSLDQRFAVAYEEALQGSIEDNVSVEQIGLPFSEATTFVFDDVLSRSRTTLPVSTVAAGVVGGGGIKVVSAVIAKKMATNIAVKATARGVVKGGGVLAGAGGGAFLCSWSGPGAALCGAIGGVGAWLLADAAVVNIDEYFNREEFEADLRKLIDESRAESLDMINAALEQKALSLSDHQDVRVEGLTLQENAKSE